MQYCDGVFLTEQKKKKKKKDNNNDMHLRVEFKEFLLVNGAIGGSIIFRPDIFPMKIFSLDQDQDQD